MIISNLVLMIAVAGVSGLIGVFSLMRKMTLASDAISHVALPGLGLALLMRVNPVLGGAAALLLGVLIIWLVERRTQIATETIIGVIFSASLAIGSLLTPNEELIDALFGEAGGATALQWGIGMAAVAAIALFILRYKEKLTLSLVSRDLAIVSGINVPRMDLLFLLAFALNVILGLQFLGVLLMGSLIIVPAAFARNLGKSLNATLVIAAFAAIGSVIAGSAIATAYGLALGPVIISVAAALFFLSLFVPKN